MGTADRPLHHLQTPDHRPGFWADVEAGLRAEAQGARPAARPPRPVRRAFTLTAAAILLAVVVATAGLRDHEVTTPIDTADRPVPSAVQDEGPARAATAWIRALADGDMRLAWDELGPASKEAWASFEAFAGAEGSFGLAQWAGEGVDVTVTRVRAAPRDPMYVVTFARGSEAYAVAVRGLPSGYAVEPFTPHDTIGLQFVAPGVHAPQDPVVVAVPDEQTEASLVVDGAADPVTPAPTGRRNPQGIELAYLPAGGWPPGRHVVTAFALYEDGTPAATAVVFDVGGG